MMNEAPPSITMQKRSVLAEEPARGRRAESDEMWRCRGDGGLAGRWAQEPRDAGRADGGVGQQGFPPRSPAPPPLSEKVSVGEARAGWESRSGVQSLLCSALLCGLE